MHIDKNTLYNKEKVKVTLMVLNATFDNIAVISWRSVLLEEETGVPGENHPQFTDKLLSHNVVKSTPRLNGIRTHNVSGDRH